MFANATETNIPYALAAPFVQVVYFQDGKYVTNPHGSGVQFKDGNIKINHGGLSSGFAIVK